MEAAHVVQNVDAVGLGVRGGEGEKGQPAFRHVKLWLSSKISKPPQIEAAASRPRHERTRDNITTNSLSGFKPMGTLLSRAGGLYENTLFLVEVYGGYWDSAQQSVRPPCKLNGALWLPPRGICPSGPQ